MKLVRQVDSKNRIIYPMAIITIQYSPPLTLSCGLKNKKTCNYQYYWSRERERQQTWLTCFNESLTEAQCTVNVFIFSFKCFHLFLSQLQNIPRVASIAQHSADNITKLIRVLQKPLKFSNLDATIGYFLYKFCQETVGLSHYICNFISEVPLEGLITCWQQEDICFTQFG